MIQRILLEELRRWKDNESRMPLVIRGARQTGKTTLVDAFSEEFGVYLKLNLDEEAACALFEHYTDIDRLIDAIYLYNRKEKSDMPTLLFIDEIQNSSRAVAMLRYFYEKASWLYVIAAGSLLESLTVRHISFPVGRVEYLALRPCNFIEYLDGVGEQFDRKALLELKADMIHERMMSHFKMYSIVGGMPKVITEYAKKRDLLATDRIFESLLTSYKDDVEKYAPNNTLMHVMRFIIESGWTYGGETIAFEHFANSNYRSREMGESFRIIEKTMLLELVYPVTSCRLPLQPSYTHRPKLIWLDTGLVNYSSGIREELFATANFQDVYKGRIAEHIVAQELLSINHKVSANRVFWVNPQKGSSAEVDFVISFDGKLVPIEVKNGHNAHLRSLQTFMEKASMSNIAVRVWNQPLSIDHITLASGREYTLINLPFYYVGQIYTILEKVMPRR